jgi:GntR family transcriptional regulator of arabinose operon
MISFQIHKDSPIPLHEQLLNELRRAILSGELEPGRRIPSEPELFESLKISRTTIRQAWDAAVREGLLYRVQGKGTFVAQYANARTAQQIGFLIPDFRSTFDSQLLSGAEHYLRERGCRVVFAHTERDIQEENRLLSEMWGEGVAGFLLWPAISDREPRFLAQQKFVPTVFMDRPIPGLEYPCIAAEHYRGACMAVEHLLQLGHREIAFVSRPHLQLWPIAERLHGYEETMRAAGLTPYPSVLVGTEQELSPRYAQQSYAQARGDEISQLCDLLSRKERPTALFAMNDLMALQVLRAATLAGLHVPDDLSLVGFDDMEIVSHIDPPLTTVAQDPFSIGSEAARCLLDMINRGRRWSQLISLPVQLIVRQSTARLKA